MPAGSDATGGSISAPDAVAVSDGSAFDIVLSATTAHPGYSVDFVSVSIEGSGISHLIPVDPVVTARSQRIFLPGESGSLRAERVTSTGTNLGETVIRVRGMCSAFPPAGDLVAGADYPPRMRFDVHASPPTDRYIIGSGGDLNALLDRLDFGNRDRWLLPIYRPTQYTRTATGLLQVNVTWDTNADIDLWMIEPNGFKIYYSAKNSTVTGGKLDVDDTNGFGPENIFYTTLPTSGQYTVKVNHYGGTVPTNYTVTINRQGQARQVFTGRLTARDQTDTVSTLFFGTSN